MSDPAELIQFRKKLKELIDEQDNVAKTICVVSFVIICIGCILHFCFVDEENNDDIPKKDKRVHAAGFPLAAAGIASILCIVFVHRPAIRVPLEKIDKHIKVAGEEQPPLSP